MARIELRHAAILAQHAYKPHTITSPRIVDTLDRDHVQAYLTETGLLLLPGSNSVLDYLHFNLRVFNVGQRKFRLASTETEAGACGTIWHQGFLVYARAVYDWLDGRRPEMIVGHSLGAAAVQILSKTFDRPGIGFAAPRPRKGHGPVADDDKCLSVCRVDDTVCALPPTFHHLGDARFLEPPAANWGLDHSMQNYRRILEENRGPDTLPEIWPV